MINRFGALLQKLLSDSNNFKNILCKLAYIIIIGYIGQGKFETGSAYIENLMMKTKYWKNAMSFLKWNCLLLIMIALIVGVIILFCVIYGVI